MFKTFNAYFKLYKSQVISESVLFSCEYILVSLKDGIFINCARIKSSSSLALFNDLFSVAAQLSSNTN